MLEAIKLREFGINAAPFICLALLPRPPLRSACGLRPRDAPLFRPRLARPYNSPQLHQRFGLVLEAIQLREFGIYAAPFICLALLPRPPLNSTNSTDSEQLYLYRI